MSRGPFCTKPYIPPLVHRLVFVLDRWKEDTGDEAKRFRIKYYKGLGTSTAAEAKEYFSNLDLHEIHFSDISSDKFIKREHVKEEDNPEEAHEDTVMEIDKPTPDAVV